jgi:hypothetical protein
MAVGEPIGIIGCGALQLCIRIGQDGNWRSRNDGETQREQWGKPHSMN